MSAVVFQSSFYGKDPFLFIDSSMALSILSWAVYNHLFVYRTIPKYIIKSIWLQGWGGGTLVRQKKALTLAVPPCSPMETSQRDLWAYYFRNRRLDKKRTVGFEDLRVLRLPQCRGGGGTELHLYCVGRCETVACLGATRQWRCETVACLDATRPCLNLEAARQHLVWMLQDSSNVKCCRTVHCVGAEDSAFT